MQWPCRHGERDLELENERKVDPNLKTAMPPLERLKPVDMCAKEATPCPVEDITVPR